MDGKMLLLAQVGFALAFAGISSPLAMAQSKRKPGLYAIFQTNQGTIVCELYDKDAPITVKNFVDLAEGAKEWKDPRTGAMKKTHYFDGIVFHRVIPEFMIQGGDPTGTGTGGPGYKFQDEFSPKLKFDKPGRLAMANAGPGTNGSQFFITEGNTEFLNNKHTIFGQVIEGMDNVKKIARVPRNASDKPNQPVVIEKLTIERVPAAGV